MATVHYGDHKPFEIDDNRADLIAYYRGEGADVVLDSEKDEDGEDEQDAGGESGEQSGDASLDLDQGAPEVTNVALDEPEH